MKIARTVAVLATAAAFALSGCSQPSAKITPAIPAKTTSSAAAAPTATETVPSAPVATPDIIVPPTEATDYIDPTETDNGEILAAFGDTVTYDDGLAITISEPKAFNPSNSACCQIEEYKNFAMFVVTVENGTKERVEPASFYLALASGTRDGEQVFDSAKKITGGPDTSLRAGKTATWKVVFGVDDVKDLHMEVSTDFMRKTAYYDTK